MGKPRGRKLAKKQDHITDDKEVEQAHYHQTAIEENENPSDPQMFFGVLDRDQLEYFKQAESSLSLDAFESPDEKLQFLTSVVNEIHGKELKLATSQICSKLMERLILESDGIQLKNIFKSFNGYFYNLSCHKYSSHVVETLLVKSAAIVEKELLTISFDMDNTSTVDSEEPLVTMENMFLFMVNEVKPHIHEMVKHQYASHVVRLLILILSSKTLPRTTQNRSTLRSKRSKIARKMIDIKDTDEFDKAYKTPESFKIELKEILSTYYQRLTNGASSRADVSMTHVTKFRELCIDKVASPTIQLIIQVEGIFDRDRSFWRLVFGSGDDKDPKEEAFVEYLLSDPVGSHFLENVVAFARTKYVERLYHLYIEARVEKLAKRDSTGAFVVQSLLKHLKSRDVKFILDKIVPELSMLLNSNMDFGTSIIEASIKEGNYLREQVIEQLVRKFYPQENQERNILESCLELSSSTLGNTKDDWPTANERRRSLFLESLIDFDDKFLEITIESMLSLPEERLLQMCYHGVFSHVIEHVLDVKRVDIIKRKLILNILCKDIINLSCNAYASHIVDALWAFTTKLMLYKERIANALLKESDKVKNSMYGKQVWKNWKLELYARKRFDWKMAVKDQEAEMLAEVAKPEVQEQSNKRNSMNNQEQTWPKKHKR